MLDALESFWRFGATGVLHMKPIARWRAWVVAVLDPHDYENVRVFWLRCCGMGQADQCPRGRARTTAQPARPPRRPARRATRYDGLKLPGLSVFVNAVFGSDAIDAATRSSFSDKTEYDGTVDYRFNGGGWPAWLKPLWIRARAPRVEEKFAGVTDGTKDYRIIMNYEWVFK